MFNPNHWSYAASDEFSKIQQNIDKYEIRDNKVVIPIEEGRPEIYYFYSTPLPPRSDGCTRYISKTSGYSVLAIGYNKSSNKWEHFYIADGSRLQVSGLKYQVYSMDGSVPAKTIIMSANPMRNVDYLFENETYSNIFLLYPDNVDSEYNKFLFKLDCPGSGPSSAARPAFGGAGGGSSAAAAGGGSSSAATGVFRNRNSFPSATAPPLNSTFGVMGGPRTLSIGPITGASLSHPFGAVGKRGGARITKKLSKKKGSKHQKKAKSQKRAKSRKIQKSHN
jgi:hypothetical protein